MLKLRTNIIWLFLGYGIYATSQWGVLIVLIQLGGVESVGRFSLALAVTAPIFIFSNLSLASIFATDARHIYNFSDYLALRLITTIIALLITIGIVELSDYDKETHIVIIIMGIVKSIESISDIYYGLEQRYERFDLLSKSLILRGIFGLTALSLSYYLTNSLAASVAAMGLVWLLVCIFYDIDNDLPGSLSLKNIFFSTEICNFRLNQNFSLLKLSIPMGFTAMLISLNSNIPRYFVQYYFGEKALGAFASLAYLIIVGGLVIGTLGQTLSPRLANSFVKNNLDHFWRIIIKMLITALIFGITGILTVKLFGQQLLIFIYGKSFIDKSDSLIYIMITASVSYLASVMNYVMVAMHIFKIQPLLFIIVILTNFTGCCFLVSSYGINGAIWALMIAFLVQFILTFFTVLRRGSRLWPFFR